MTRSSTGNEALQLLELLQGLGQRMEAQARATGVTNSNLAALTTAVENLTEVLLQWGRFAQQSAGVQMQAQMALSRQDRKDELLSNLTDNLFNFLGGGGRRRKSGQKSR